MRTTLAALAAVLAVCWSMHQSLAQTSDAKADFELVDKIGSKRAYELFLGTHRTGPYADLARKRLHEMDLAQASDVKADFEMVEKIGTRKAYEVFLGTYRTGPFADLARKRLHDMDPPGHTKPNWGDEIFIPRLMDRQK